MSSNSRNIIHDINHLSSWIQVLSRKNEHIRDSDWKYILRILNQIKEYAKILDKDEHFFTMTEHRKKVKEDFLREINNTKEAHRYIFEDYDLESLLEAFDAFSKAFQFEKE